MNVTLDQQDSHSLLAYTKLLLSALLYCLILKGFKRLGSVGFTSIHTNHLTHAQFCLCVSVSSAAQRHLVQNVLV